MRSCSRIQYCTHLIFIFYIGCCTDVIASHVSILFFFFMKLLSFVLLFIEAPCHLWLLKWFFNVWCRNVAHELHERVDWSSVFIKLSFHPFRYFNEMSAQGLRARTVSSPIPYTPSPSSSRPISPGMSILRLRHRKRPGFSFSFK